MEYTVGQRLSWIPEYWKWDERKDVFVKKLYPNNRALLSNGVIVDKDGLAMIYGSGKFVGKVVEIVELVELPPPEPVVLTLVK